MATRKINRKKNFTQRKKYKKRGNKLLNTQKRIRKQSKINRQLMRKQTCKINRCKKCKGVKNLKISKKKLDKLRNAGGLLSDAVGYLRENVPELCCGNNSDAVFEGTTNSKGELIPNDATRANGVRVSSEAIPNDAPVLPEAIPNDAPVLPVVRPNDGPLSALRERRGDVTFTKKWAVAAEAKKKQELKADRNKRDLKNKFIRAIIDAYRHKLEQHRLQRSMNAYAERKKAERKKYISSEVSPVVDSEQNLMSADPYDGEFNV